MPPLLPANQAPTAQQPMVKQQKPSRSAPPAKKPAAKASAAKAPPAKPISKKLPPATTKTAKLPAGKAPAVKSPPPSAKTPPRKVPAAKPVAVKQQATKSKPAKASVEQSPATEAQIVEALAGKLSSRPAGTGFSWLASMPVPKSEAVVIPEDEPQVEAPAIEAPVADEVIEPAPAEILQINAEPAADSPSAAAPAPASDEAPETPAAEEQTPPQVEEVKAEVCDTVIPELKALLPQAAANEQSLATTAKAVGDRIGWTLTIQAAVFVAFCVLAAKDVPRGGMQQFLLGATPLFAMMLLGVGLANYRGVQLMLEKLEAERLNLQQQMSETGASAGPDSFANARRLAHLPSLIILGVLFVVWLYLGLTVWFL